MNNKHQEINVEQDRHLYIGGSDLPYILGYAEKFGETIMGFAKQKLGIIPRTFKGNEYTRYGHVMEPMVRDYINNVFKYNFKEDSKIDSSRGYRGNCDGLDRKKSTLLEVKTFRGKLDIKYYEPQCQFYMDIFDVDECLLVGYERPADFYSGVDYELENADHFFDYSFDSQNITVYKISRNKEMFEEIEVEINKFKYLLEALRKEVILNDNTIERLI